MIQVVGNKNIYTKNNVRKEALINKDETSHLSKNDNLSLSFNGHVKGRAQVKNELLVYAFTTIFGGIATSFAKLYKKLSSKKEIDK